MNNKGFTFIELLVTISLTIPLVFALIVVPAYLMKDYKDYDKLAQHTAELSIIKSILASDLESTTIKELDEDNVQIGKSIYRFNDDGLYRVNEGNSRKLSEEHLFYKVEQLGTKKVLNIYNDNTNLEFSIGNSSFDLKE